jgi:hypothetical protein
VSIVLGASEEDAAASTEEDMGTSTDEDMDLLLQASMPVFSPIVRQCLAMQDSLLSTPEIRMKR